MGLVSYLKDLYYNSRVNKASKLLSEGRSSEAEKILISILDKHPMAVANLAEFYYTLSKSADVVKVVSLFEKVISLEGKGAHIYDAKAYNRVLTKFVNDILSKSKEFFNSSSFSECSALLSSINKTKCKSEQSVNLCCQSDINILLQKIANTKLKDKNFTPTIQQLESLWKCGNNIPYVKETILDFCDKQCSAKRYYVAAIVLGVVLGNKHHEDCLQKIAHVISGDDVEIDTKAIKDVVANYGKKLVLRKGIQVSESLTLFEKCWQQSSDCGFVIDVLGECNNAELKSAIVARIIDNHQTYLVNSGLFNCFTKWISESYEVKESIEIYEKIHNAGYKVEDYYVGKVHIWIESLSYELKVLSLDKARTLYPKSKVILADTLDCAKWYESQGENNTAIQIADSIISDCKEAKVVKAKALCNLGNKESNTDKRRQYIEQSFSALDNSNAEGSDVVRQYIQQSYLNVAEQYYSDGDLDSCYCILHLLSKQNYDKALISIASHRLSEANNCQNVTEKLQKVNDAVDEINGYKTSIVTTSEYCSLWSEKINTSIEIYRNLDNHSAISEYEKLITDIKAVGFDNVYTTSKCTLLLNHIIERKYIIARELEKSNNLNDAAAAYKEINALEKKRVPTLSALRFILCKLKLGNTADVLQHKDKIYSLLKNAAQAFKAEKDDIAYRFSLALLKAGEDQEALSVLIEYLPGEVQLKKACEQGAMIKAQAKLEDFNQKLDAVKNKTLSANDAVYFINHMLEYAEIIKPILDLPRAKLSKYRAKLKNYAIFKLFDEGKFDVAFDKMIKEHSDYLEDLTALRNIALICLNIVEGKQLKKSNYQEVISVWLTAIYQEKLFVKSLDYTSWDNQYKFTLQNAYGHFEEYEYDDLPDNVNFDDPEENSIISIREVQRALLDRFEAAITDNQTYHEFYTAQKDAMDALIALNLDEKCTLVAPFLANKDEKIFDEISTAFNSELDGHYGNWEDVLSVGALYQLSGSVYSNYSAAKDLFMSLKDAIASKNNVRLFTPSNVDKIKEFNNMYSSFTSLVGSKVAALKSDDRTTFKSNFDFYINVCASIKDSAISFTFSNYVMHYIVGEVNNGKMKNAEAAKFILSVFMLDTSNARVKDNLTTLFEMLSRDKSADASAAVNTILSKVQTVDSAFYRRLKSEYEEAQIDKELNDIVDKVNSHSMSEAQALSKVFALYQNNSNSERVCGNLAQLCDMCIMKYIIQQEYGGSSVAGILDRVYNNMSSEFQKHRKKFAESYKAIWGQLPSDAKLTIQGFNPNATLNDSGRALKRGLDYYKQFGGVTESSSLSDLFGLGGLGGRRRF